MKKAKLNLFNSAAECAVHAALAPLLRCRAATPVEDKKKSRCYLSTSFSLTALVPSHSSGSIGALFGQAPSRST